MLSFLKVFFWGSLTSQSIIAVLLWLCAGAAFYELNYTVQDSKEFSPIMIGIFIVSFILGSYVYTKGNNSRSLEDQIASGVSKARSPALSGLSELVAIGFITIVIAVFFIAVLRVMIYIASVYTVYVIGVQFYKKKKLSVQN